MNSPPDAESTSGGLFLCKEIYQLKLLNKADIFVAKI